MKIPMYQVDAFTDRLFGGNPAAVCPLEEWLPDQTMQAIAAENNLSETAFFVPEDEGFGLRWFTPVREVDLCGHATLATAHLILRRLESERTAVEFATRSGKLTVTRQDDLLEMNFPAYPTTTAEPPAGLLEALGSPPEAVLQGNYLMAVFPSERTVKELEPRFGVMTDNGIDETIVTAPGTDCDFVSRFFAPGYGVDEDPVTGSAHCTLVPYWAHRLGKTDLTAKQISHRGGELFCGLEGDRVSIAGNAVTYMEGTIEID